MRHVPMTYTIEDLRAGVDSKQDRQKQEALPWAIFQKRNSMNVFLGMHRLTTGRAS